MAEAKICKHCGSSQSKWVYVANSFVNLGTLGISLLALAVSVAAFYFSRVTEPSIPELVVQVDRFDETGFSFFVANLGELPTAVRDFDLKISLAQGAGTHFVEAAFSVPPSQIPPGDSRLFQIEYASFVPNYTRWSASGDAQEPFTLNFLALAATLGSNLHCEVNVYYTSPRYFPNNFDGASGSVNGTCRAAMKWYAESIGPLRIESPSESPTQQP